MGVTRITLKWPFYLGERGEGCCSGGERRTLSLILIGDGQGLVHGQGMEGSVKFHRRDWR